MKLIKKIKYSGTITVITGLHIGGTNTSLGIGGVDKTVVRNPIDNLPYIPGSSLKGKLRSLLEMKHNRVDKDGKPSSGDNEVTRLFGTSGDNNGGRRSRLIVRDAFLNKEASKGLEKAELYYAEAKTENSINRITVVSNPRTNERVPAGAVFNLELIIDVYDDDNEKELRDILWEGINLLHEDYLGGNGSRGYGQVKIDIKEV